MIAWMLLPSAVMFDSGIGLLLAAASFGVPAPPMSRTVEGIEPWDHS